MYLRLRVSQEVSHWKCHYLHTAIRTCTLLYYPTWNEKNWNITDTCH